MEIEKGKRKMFSLIFVLVCFVALLFSSGCATIGTMPTKTFDKLTPDEQARVILSSIQYGSDPLFDIGKTIMLIKPEYMAVWKSGIVPAFNELNFILLDLEMKGKDGQEITGPVILQALQGRVAQLVSTIARFGTIQVSPATKANADNYGLVAVMGISTAIVAWNDIIAAMSGVIPTWDIIMARNLALQEKINMEM